MAVIQYSALLTQLRGKLGGSQFNKSHSGYTLQRKATQPRRDSRAQSVQRQRVQLVQRLWKEESPQRQAEAQQAANSNPTTDRFGQQVVLSGYQQYIKIQLWRLMGNNSLDQVFITTPVNAAELSISVNDISVVYNPSTGNYDFSFDVVRSTSGTPSGVMSSTRGFIYFTKVDQNGNELRPVRRVFVRFVTFASGAPSSDTSVSVTGISFSPGDWVRMDVATVQTQAGAITGFNSQLVQLS